MTPLLADRRAGVLLHVTSLPSDLPVAGPGPEARAFVDWLADAGAAAWQILPLVPTHPEDGSPYNGLAALAMNPQLISLRQLEADGWLSPAEIEHVVAGRMRPSAVRTLAARRFARSQARGQDPAYAAFLAEQEHWLPDYCAFVALRESLDLAPWIEWPERLRDRDPAALADALAPLRGRQDVLAAEQWLFSVQWARLRAYAADRGVALVGDIPIFVSHDSADVWSHREEFRLDAAGHPTVVTGCPPDYFAEDGQLWNNPHYDWEAMRATGWRWWRDRLRAQLDLVDVVRIDHFRGLESAWYVPGGAETARDGEWRPSPGAEILTALQADAPPQSLIAEDLGTITAEVDGLRRRFGLPGMRVLQFAFDGNADNPHLPANFDRHTVAYTGTHDNPTTCGWWDDLEDAERRRLAELSGVPLEDLDVRIPWPLIRMTLESPADLAVVPAQDLLGLGDDARMNTPGTATGNWAWRAPLGAFDERLAARLRELVESAGRAPGTGGPAAGAAGDDVGG